jgi:lactoylglutathione lyase
LDLGTYSEEDPMTDWPGGLTAITPFAEDLPATKQFYFEIFELPVEFADDNSAVFKFGQTLINLLDVSAAPELIQPARVGDQDGQRIVFTLEVDDVDAKGP